MCHADSPCGASAHARTKKLHICKCNFVTERRVYLRETVLSGTKCRVSNLLLKSRKFVAPLCEKFREPCRQITRARKGLNRAKEERGCGHEIALDMAISQFAARARHTVAVRITRRSPSASALNLPLAASSEE